MEAHIPKQLLERYDRRQATPDEILRVQGHAAMCDACRAALGATRKFGVSIANVHAGLILGSEEFEHLRFDQLEGLVDGKLDPVEREIAESHFAVCTECTEDFANLQIFRGIAEAAGPLPIEQEKKSFWSGVFALPRLALFAPAAALLLIAVALGVWFLAAGPDTGTVAINANLSPIFADPQTPAASPADVAEVRPNAETPQTDPVVETAYALNDGPIKLALGGDVAGLENLPPQTRELVNESLRLQRVSVTNHSLGGSTGILMGARTSPSAGVPFGLETPIGKVIKETHPLLKWRPLDQAASYSVAVVDEQFRVVTESGELKTTSWKPTKPLPRGANYAWQVTATLEDGTQTISPSSPAPQARFRVIEQSLADEIGRLEREPDRSHMALGVLYARAGLRVEAKAEFEKLVKANPNSKVARRLLQSIE